MPLILVVDDDEINRKLLVDLLSVYGYESITAKDGKEAVEVAKEKKPDLIFMDIQMPMLDGISAVKILKNDPETKSIKIIVLSAYAFSEDVKKALEAGADEYLTKPFDTRKIPEIVKRYIKD